VSEADFEELKKFFTEAEILELNMTAALANLTNRFTGPFGLELEIPEQKL
jgi:alkylhydroperoxidase family enzyme